MAVLVAPIGKSDGRLVRGIIEQVGLIEPLRVERAISRLRRSRSVVKRFAHSRAFAALQGFRPFDIVREVVGVLPEPCRMLRSASATFADRLSQRPVIKPFVAVGRNPERVELENRLFPGGGHCGLSSPRLRSARKSQTHFDRAHSQSPRSLGFNCSEAATGRLVDARKANLSSAFSSSGRRPLIEAGCHLHFLSDQESNGHTGLNAKHIVCRT